MFAELFKEAVLPEAGNKKGLPVEESAMWKALGMDKLTSEMSQDTLTGQDTVYMGTGYTHNACMMCGNSHTGQQFCPR